MFDDVMYFIRSCVECQKLIKTSPILPYSESWQAPLLHHFDLDCIVMPSGVRGFEYIVQAIERTILWAEARALKSQTSRLVAKFIYKEIICRFSCRHHQMIVDPLFKCMGDAKGNWPHFLFAVLFALQVTVSHATGFSLFYLLYGAQPIFFFDVTEITWQTLDWDKVHTHDELIAI
ncbi:hypothetical protein ARMGADRAFT_915567 [Armillaria gallica]|uniref:Integrase zinc-binding domain-containing protein n=1 Tax=Armillaria gallica TaxID=47427 RepID=A0A2H3ENQ1_ARMGA|nr:hypothetical protein ARMGADRAFT_915567 [Armillaria gallica]